MKGRFPRKRKLKKISRVSLSAIAKNLCIFEHYFFAAFLNDQGFDKNCYYPRALILLGAQKESLCTNIYITAGEAAWMRTFFFAALQQVQRPELLAGFRFLHINSSMTLLLV